MAKLNLSPAFRVSRTPSSSLERIEVDYLFRVSRGVPLALASLASLVLVGSVLVLLYSVIPPRAAREPAPAVTPAEVSVSMQDVRAALRPTPVGDAGVTTTTTTTTTPGAAAAPAVDASVLRLGRAVAAVQALFPASRYSWEDRFTTVCDEVFFGTCYRTRQVQSAEGIGPLVRRALSIYDAGQGEQWVPVGAGGGYSLNPSNAEKKTQVLGELRRLLATAPVAERRDVLQAWGTLRREREEARQAQVAAEEARVARERMEEQARYAAEAAARSTARATAASALGTALGALWMIGLTLAVLAIERNTRAFRNLAAAPTREAEAPRPMPAYAPQS